MTDAVQGSPSGPTGPAPKTVDIGAVVQARLAQRHKAERRFKATGLTAIIVALGFLVILLSSIIHQGYAAFWSNAIEVPVALAPGKIDPADIDGANYDMIVATALLSKVGAPDDDLGENAVAMKGLMSVDVGYRLHDRVKADPSLIGKSIVLDGKVSDDADLYLKGEVKRSVPEEQRKLSNKQLDWLDKLKAQGIIKGGLNTSLLTRSDSTEPELAGLLGAIVGSALTLVITGALAVPIGVLAAVYLEEFSPKNRLTDFIEVNINNLAAVPSIVYGLLGLALFINWLGFARSSPVVGGLVLALMALPTVIIATRSSLKAVPPSIREAALGMGASRTQTVFHHVLPLAMPGMMTGAILAMAHALGETAPLLMIGMVSFVPGVPQGFNAAATVLPVQIFIWENASERAFHERTAAAIMVLLVFMIIMNLAAIILRRRFERRW
jgi:phosphate transport system permease protein